MDQGPLVTEQIDAGAELVRQFEQYKPVKAAFWLKASEDARPYLYVASDEIDETNFVLAYGEVVRLLNRMRNPYLDFFRVKVIRGDDPLAQAAVEYHQRFPGRMATRIRESSFGGVFADEAYIYPSPVPAPIS